MGFNTLRNYTPLKHPRFNRQSNRSFNTLRNYTPLKPRGNAGRLPECFNTLRNYTPLKPQILRFFGISHHKCQMWVISKRAPQIIPE